MYIVYLVANPKREFEFKMDISSMYITLETIYVFTLNVYYSRIKVTEFWQCRRVYAGTVYISCLFGCKPTKGIGIQSGR